jgi:hypothetical protein
MYPSDPGMYTEAAALRRLKTEPREGQVSHIKQEAGSGTLDDDWDS